MTISTQPVDHPELVTIDQLKISTDDTVLVPNLALTIKPGERVGLIGESGSGKSLTALSLMGLLPDELNAQGNVSIRNICDDILNTPDRELSKMRGRRVSMVFQEPMSALNPLMKVGKQIAEVLLQHGTVGSRKEAQQRVRKLIEDVHLPDPPRIMRSYPYQLSGGQRQRVMLAIAFANDPELIICDEPTTALDVTVQRQVLDLLDDAVRSRGASLLFVSHDLGVIAEVCDRVMVMQQGRIVESGTVRDVLTAPQHEYTRRLLSASKLEELKEDTPGRPPHIEASTTETPQPQPIIQVRSLTRTFSTGQHRVNALKDINLEVAAGDRVGIVGESGSGKTTLLKILAGLDRPTAGEIEVCGVDVRRASHRGLKPLRQRLQIVFQDPMGSLDPRMNIQEIIEEPLLRTRRDTPNAKVRQELVQESLEAVELPPDVIPRYPHQFSGGQRQRISIARALITNPDVLIADEPVSALDVSVQAQVLKLLNALVEDRGMTLLMVSHDLSVVRHICRHVAVMRQGEIVEAGDTEQVYRNPTHDYTRRLLEAVPSLDQIIRNRV
ncbi:MAG TPA: ABC transporter ATP-binding protein [Enteractinococcus sp.]